jgi:1-acyl-sn-glycerol-3-phosphate acyltransferase
MTGYTISDIPGLPTVLQIVSLIFLKTLGWRRECGPPDIPQYVVVAAPHTSNWDFPFGLAFIFSWKMKVYWMGKHTLFRRPYGWFFRWLGGIPIDRTKSINAVAQSVQAFREIPQLVMMISPEGTRRKVKEWKTGFYHIAQGAGVPIVPAFLDFRKKTGGFGKIMNPTGNVEADMDAIRAFYAGVSGKYPEKSSAAA